MITFPLISFPAKFDGICEDCQKVILTDTEDCVPFFEDGRCKKCQAEMYAYMQEADEALVF